MSDLVNAARRAEGSEVLPRVMLGRFRADDLILRMTARIEALEAALLAADELKREIDRVCGILADDHGHPPVTLNRLLEDYRRATGGGE